MEDDGTPAFGELIENDPEPADWDTPEWRAEMAAKYANVND